MILYSFFSRVVIYIAIAMILLVIELIYFRLALKFDITDSPNRRSSHTRPTIRGGGIVFPFAILLYGFLFHALSWWWIGGLMLISFISFLDDISSLPNKVRIIVHLIAVSFLFYGLRLFSIWPVTLVGLAYILVIGTINACNFMDGINGITALYSLSVLITLFYINLVNHFTNSALLYIIGISLLIFSFFNCRKKAICFAGDVGAVSIGFILIFLVLLLIVATQNPIFVLLFSVYGIDSVMTIFYRLSQKENIFEAHRSHLYQLIANEYKMPQVFVSVIYFMTQILVNVIWINALSCSFQIQWLIGGILLAALILIYWVIRYRLMRMVNKVVSE